jgi:putative spermidine/putrescine transport system permease protein
MSVEVQGKRSRAWRPELESRASLLLALPFILIAAAFIIYPVIRLVDTALFRGEPFAALTAWLENGASMRVLGHTLLISGIVVVLSLVIGSALAWTMRVTNSTVVRLLIGAGVLLPMWMGSVMKIYAWTVMLQSFGVVNNLLVGIGLIPEDGRLQLLYTDGAVVTGMVYHMVPYAVLGMLVGFASIDLGLVDAARGLGASSFRVARTVIAPLSIGSILATAVLIYVMSIGFFLTPVVLGGATAPFSASFIAQDIFTFFDVPSAAVSALALMVTGAAIIGLGFVVVGKERMRRAIG